jgi:hypothetical protein
MQADKDRQSTCRQTKIGGHVIMYRNSRARPNIICMQAYTREDVEAPADKDRRLSMICLSLDCFGKSTTKDTKIV